MRGGAFADRTNQFMRFQTGTGPYVELADTQASILCAFDDDDGSVVAAKVVDGQGFAEVEFVGTDSNHYVARWSVRRSVSGAYGLAARCLAQ